MSKPFLLAAVAAASLVSFGFQPVTNNASFTRDGVTYVQRGGLKNSDFVATNVDASAVSRVTSVNSKTGAVHLAYSDVGALPATTSHLPGDVPTNRTVNAKSLDANVTLDASDVSALPDDYVKLTNSATFKSAVETVSPPVELPAKWALANVTNASGGTVTAGDVNALPSSTTHLSGDVPTTRTVNEYPLSSDITLDASDVGALSTSDGGSVNGDVDVTGALTAASFATDGEVYMNGSTYIEEAQIDSVTGPASFDDDVSVSGDMTVGGSLTVTGATVFDGTLQGGGVVLSENDVTYNGTHSLIALENTVGGKMDADVLANAWNQGTSYQKGAFVLHSSDYYESLTNDNIGHFPYSSPTYWKKMKPLLQKVTEEYVPTVRTVNGKPLSANVQLTANDIGISDFTTTTAVEKISSTQITNSVQSGYLCTVAAAQDMRDTRLPAQYIQPQERWAIINEVYFSSDVAIGNTLSVSGNAYFYGFESIIAGNQYLPEYLDSLVWRTTGDHSLSSYGITDAYTKTEIDGTSVTNLGAVVAATNSAKAYADAISYMKRDVDDLNVYGDELVWDFTPFRAVDPNLGTVYMVTTHESGGWILVLSSSPSSPNPVAVERNKYYATQAAALAETRFTPSYAPQHSALNGITIYKKRPVVDEIAKVSHSTNYYTKSDVDGISVTNLGAVAVATNTINRIKDLHYDAGLNVTWTNVIDNGHIYYVTVTNANITTP